MATTSNPPSNSYIDAHCHLAAPEFKDDLHAVLSRSQAAGVKACVVVSESLPEFEEVLEICATYPGKLFPCLGIHPVQHGNTSVTLKEVEAALPLLHTYSADIVGIGEASVKILYFVTNKL